MQRSEPTWKGFIVVSSITSNKWVGIDKGILRSIVIKLLENLLDLVHIDWLVQNFRHADLIASVD
jgi:hypothetical protein